MFGLTDERYNQMMERYNYNQQFVKEIVNTYGADNCNRGYIVVNDYTPDLLRIKPIFDVGAFLNVEDAALAAKENGMKIIPLEELPELIPDSMKFYGWIDTELNRILLQKLCDKLTVYVYDNLLSLDGIGDFVRCNDCGKKMLIGIGDKICPCCKSDNLIWPNNNFQEIDEKTLCDLGYIVRRVTSNLKQNKGCD